MAALLLALIVGTPRATEPARQPLRLRPAALPGHQALNLVNSSGPAPYSDRGMTTWGGSVGMNPLTGWPPPHLRRGLCWPPRPVKLGDQLPHRHGHTSSTGPGGSFNSSALTIPVGPFAHNPEAIIYSPREKKYMLFVLGYMYENASAVVGCDSQGRPKGHYADGIPPWLSTVSLHTAAAPHGPWSSGTASDRRPRGRPRRRTAPNTGQPHPWPHRLWIYCSTLQCDLQVSDRRNV